MEKSEIGKDFLENFIKNLVEKIAEKMPKNDEFKYSSEGDSLQLTSVKNIEESQRFIQQPQFKTIQQEPQVSWTYPSFIQSFTKSPTIDKAAPRIQSRQALYKMVPSMLRQRSGALPISSDMAQSEEIVAVPTDLSNTLRPLVQEVGAIPPTTGQTQIVKGDPLEKLISFLRDPMVRSIDCPGAGQNVIINRSGKIQQTNIIFTPAEIEEIMNFYSQKTRIPLITGTFKAAFQEHIINAVISDSVGIKFNIQRKPRAPIPYRRF